MLRRFEVCCALVILGWICKVLGEDGLGIEEISGFPKLITVRCTVSHQALTHMVQFRVQGSGFKV